MGSQLDLDQGGSYRQFSRRWLGPSMGWVWTPQTNVVAVTAGGTTIALPGTTLITVNFNGAVTIQLPSSKASVNATNGALPGLTLALPITVVDIGGFAAANPITILAQAPELFDGLLPSIQLTTAYGSITVIPPNITSGGWNV